MPEPTLIVTPDLLPHPIVRIRGVSNRLYPDPALSVENTVVLTNMNITERGTTRRRHGYTPYNATVTASVDWLGLIQEKFSDGVEREVVVGNDAKIYSDDGTTRSDITGTAEVDTDSDSRVRHTIMNDQIYGTDGVKRPWSVGSTGNAAILTSSAQFSAASGDYCKDLVTHKNMLVALHTKESGTIYPTRVRWCDINPRTLVPDPTVWPTGNFSEVYYSGGAIVGGVDAFEKLLVFKTDGIYPTVLDTSTGYIELEIGTGIRSVSPLARHSIVARHDFVFCICKEGAIRVNRDLSVQVVTDDIRDDWNNNLNQARLQYAQSWILEQEHQVRTLLSSTTNSTGHDRVLVYDWESGDVWFDKPSTVFNVAAKVNISDEELSWYGDLAGTIYQSRVGDDNGTPIMWEAKMAPNDLGYPRRDKNLVNIQTYYRLLSGSASVQLQLTMNEGRVSSKTTNLSLGTSSVWNSGVKWNSGLLYLGGASLVASFFINRMAEVVAPRWTGTGDVEFLGYSIEHTLAE